MGTDEEILSKNRARFSVISQSFASVTATNATVATKGA